jgi:prophage maintenance system killer protein
VTNVDEVIVIWDGVQGYGGRHNLTGVRSKDIRSQRLEGIISQWNQSEGDVFDRAGEIWFRIVDEQPFIDCNKRTATALVDRLLVSEGYKLVATMEEMAAVVNSYTGTGRGEKERWVKWLRRNYAMRR